MMNFENQVKLGRAIGLFGGELFALLPTNRNVFISPQNIAMAFSMLLVGSKGKTAEVISDCLHFKDVEDVNGLQKTLCGSFVELAPTVKIKMANSLWGDSSVKFRESFVSILKEFYDATVESLPFSSPETIVKINKWVSNHTNGKIKEIVKQLSSSQISVLLAAIWFKGDWEKKFDKELTEKDTFSLAHGEKKKHPMMFQEGKYKYVETDTFKAIRLPYSGERIAMYVFLPDKKVGLSSFMETLNLPMFHSLRFVRRQGEIKLPRFRMEYEVELKGVLSKMGLSAIFSDSADLSGISETRMAVDEVIHKTFVQVNEEGTEAAAVTGMVMRSLSAEIPQKPFKMHVNRPFFFLIRDDFAETNLFMGTVVDPEE